MVGLKSTPVTLLLNFFFPGAGHVYADGRWKILVTNIGSSVAGSLLAGCAGEPRVYLLISFPINTICWVVGLATSSKVTWEHNFQIQATYEDEEEAQDRQNRHAAALRQQQHETEQGLREQETRARSKVTGAELAARYAKLGTYRSIEKSHS